MTVVGKCTAIARARVCCVYVLCVVCVCACVRVCVCACVCVLACVYVCGRWGRQAGRGEREAGRRARAGVGLAVVNSTFLPDCSSLKISSSYAGSEYAPFT